MEDFGRRWTVWRGRRRPRAAQAVGSNSQGVMLVQFCGQDRCLVDANGRIKISSRFLSDFQRLGGPVVAYCLPEGALGVYPAAVWLEMRHSEQPPGARAARSIVFRRQLRRFGALTQSERISNQGRLTIPTHFRVMLALEPGTEVVLVGCEIGIEVWNEGRWKQELEVLREHENRRAEADMAADLSALGPGIEGGSQPL